MNEKHHIKSVTLKKQVSESSNENHTCLFCGTEFVNKNDLELHSRLHNKNKSFICLLCKEVFPELKLLKLHDLRHSLEEAHEEMSGIENLLTPLASSPCRVCGEVFPCDEELVEHYVKNHKAVEISNNGFLGGISNGDLSSDTLDSSEEQLNYPLLREEIITKNGVMHVRFTLFDHPNIHVGEHKISAKKRNLKLDIKSKKFPKVFGNKVKVKSGLTAKLSHKVTKHKVKDGGENKQSHRDKNSKLKSNSMSVDTNTRKNKSESDVLDLSSDSDVEFLFENHKESANVKHPRHSKLLALKKKIWRSLPDTLAPPKVCHSCKKSFVSVEKYELHLLSHKKYKCKKCYKVFHTSSRLQQHTAQRHADSNCDTNQCQTCKKEFSSVVERKTHEKSHVQIKELLCSKCGKKLKIGQTLKKHNCGISTVCKFCHYEFPRLYNLRRHLTNVHKLGEDEIKQHIEISIEKKESKISPENDEEIKKSIHDTEEQLEKESISTENTIQAKISLLNGEEKEVVPSASNLSPVSLTKENKAVSSPVKEQLTLGKNSSIDKKNNMKIKKNVVSNKKENESIKKTSKKTVSNVKEIPLKQTPTKMSNSKKFLKSSSFSKKIPDKLSISKKSVKNSSTFKQIPTKLSISKKLAKNSSSSKQTPTKLSVSKKFAKNSSSSKKVPSKLSISKKLAKKAKVSVTYRSKGNAKQSVKKLLVNKDKKTTVSSKNSLSRTKKIPTPSQKSKLKPKK